MCFWSKAEEMKWRVLFRPQRNCVTYDVKLSHFFLPWRLLLSTHIFSCDAPAHPSSHWLVILLLPLCSSSVLFENPTSFSWSVVVVKLPVVLLCCLSSTRKVKSPKRKRFPAAAHYHTQSPHLGVARPDYTFHLQNGSQRGITGNIQCVCSNKHPGGVSVALKAKVSRRSQGYVTATKS